MAFKLTAARPGRACQAETRKKGEQMIRLDMESARESTVPVTPPVGPGASESPSLRPLPWARAAEPGSPGPAARRRIRAPEHAESSSASVLSCYHVTVTATSRVWPEPGPGPGRGRSAWLDPGGRGPAPAVNFGPGLTRNSPSQISDQSRFNLASPSFESESCASSCQPGCQSVGPSHALTGSNILRCR
jgi:hypothetical protein